MELFRTRRKTIFTTFYSFKGGVGRTMALLNVACILAGRGRRVLMIDFDLEAPGLTFLALKNLAPASDMRPAGLVELINDFLNDPDKSPLSDTENKALFHDHYVCQLNVPQSLQRLEGGYLDLMPCGRLDSTYEERLYSIKFDELYAEGVGQPLFKHLKKVILESGLYDYILIDSRTGFSDEGGICTRDLADHIFLVTGLNRQNVDGTVRFLHRLEASGWQEGRVIFIASPVPSGQEQLRDERIAEAKHAIEQTRFKADFSLRIPYHPRLSLDEEPFFYDWSGTDLFPAYEQILRILRELADDTPRQWIEETENAVNRRQFEKALWSLRRMQTEAPDAVVRFLVSITGTPMENIPELRAQAQPFFQLWLDIEGDDIEKNMLIRFRFGRLLLMQGDYRGAFAQFEGAFVTAQIQQNEHHLASALGFKGLLNYFRGRYNEALEEYRQALQIYENMHDPFDQDLIAVLRQLRGNVYFAQGDYDQAFQTYEEAVREFEKTGDEKINPSIMAKIGIVKVRKGEFAEGLEKIKQSNETFETLGSFAALTTGRVNYTDALLWMGDVQAALDYLSRYWDFIYKYASADTLYEAYILRAKIKKALGDIEGAAADAAVALKFYQEQDVHTALAQEAKDLANLGEKEGT